MRIAVVSPYALDVPGGVQHQVTGLVDRLRLLGEDAYAAGPGAGGREDAVDMGGWVKVRTNRSRAPLALSPRVIGQSEEALAGADVVHIHEPFMPLAGWAALRAARRAGRPVVVTFHADPPRAVGSLYRWGRGPLRRALGPALGSAVSPTARRAAEPLGIDLEMIPNAVDVSSFRVAVERNPRQAAFVGRPDPRKGLDLLLAAWPEVQERAPGSSLAVMGGGSFPKAPGVRFLGRVSESEKRAVLAGSGVFCAPNRGGESFGITIAEGMAAGCAVVASDLEAFADVLAGSGLLFRNGDRAGLADALVRALTDGGLRRRLAEAGADRVRMFDWAETAGRYLSLYRRAGGRDQ